MSEQIIEQPDEEGESDSDSGVDIDLSQALAIFPHTGSVFAVDWNH